MSVIPILVASCDAYADVWQPFFTLFFRHWPACPFPLHLGSNFRTFDDARVQTIPIGADRSWAHGVAAMLDRLHAEHVILLLEDFFVERDVDDAMVRRITELAQRRDDVASIRLAPLPPPSAISTMTFNAMPDLLRIVPPGTPYRVSAQPAVWRVDALRRYLRPGFSAWEFEQVGTQMADLSGDLFLEPSRPAIVYDHAIEKGRWREEGLRICREHGIAVDVSVRGVVTREELNARVERGTRESAIAAAKAEAIRAFRLRDRRSGLTAVRRFRNQGGSALHAVALTAFGLAGARAMRALQQFVIAQKIRRAARRNR